MGAEPSPPSLPGNAHGTAALGGGRHFSLFNEGRALKVHLNRD